MANRFTDSRKWDNDWFIELPAIYKLFWMYILDKCDHAGIYRHSEKLEKCCVDEAISWSEAVEFFHGKVVQLKENKYFIPNFVEFQYGKLNEENRCHKSVIDILEKEGAYKGLVRDLQGRKDKDKDKDKDSSYSHFEKTTLDSWNSFCEKYPTLSAIRSISPGRRKHLKERFTNKDFVAHWDKVLEKIPKSDFLQGKNDRKWRVDFDFLIKNDENYQKILEDKYANKNQKNEEISEWLKTV